MFESGQKLTIAFLSAAWLLAAPAASRAAETAPFVSAHDTVTLVSETDSVQPGHAMRIGLRFRLQPGWHVYWYNPGDAGAAPELRIPASLKPAGLEWPAPERLQEGPVTTFGYTSEVLLPETITPGEGDLHLSADANWLVCEKICVPEQAHFELHLPMGQVSPSREAEQFAQSDAQRPVHLSYAAHIAPNGTLVVTGADLTPAHVASALFFPDDNTGIELSAPQTLQFSDGALLLYLKTTEGFKSSAPLSGVLELRDQAGKMTALTLNASSGKAPAPPLSGWLRLVLFAFLGGAVLNLMPCVFPILAMKALALVRLSGAARREKIGRASCRERVCNVQCRSRWSPYHSSRRRHTRFRR